MQATSRAPKLSLDEIAAELYLPFEIYEKYKTYTTDPVINPNYIGPKALQARLMKISDEYFGGCLHLVYDFKDHA